MDKGALAKLPVEVLLWRRSTPYKNTFYQGPILDMGFRQGCHQLQGTRKLQFGVHVSCRRNTWHWGGSDLLKGNVFGALRVSGLMRKAYCPSDRSALYHSNEITQEKHVVNRPPFAFVHWWGWLVTIRIFSILSHSSTRNTPYIIVSTYSLIVGY